MSDEHPESRLTEPAAADHDAASEPCDASTASVPPTAMKKAALGAHYAALAARGAGAVLDETRRSVSDSALFDTKRPCVPLSPLGYEAERQRTVAADFVAQSPWCVGSAGIAATAAGAAFGAVAQGEGAPSAVPPFAPLPADDAGREALQPLLGAGLRHLTLQGRGLSMHDALYLARLLAPKAPDAITHLNLQGALSDAAAPPLPVDLLRAAAAEVAEEVGPEGDEESAERLQALLERHRREFTTYDEGLLAMAEVRLDRVQTLCDALALNKTVTHLDVSRNRFGAPSDEGRAKTSTLRRVAGLLDRTKKLQSVDLSGNLMGPVGVGIVAKAMTKNVTLRTLNLSGNAVMDDPADDDDQAENDDMDAVFGEMYTGLEALAELMKKNKFLRVLSLRNNGIRPEVDDSPDEDASETALGRFLEPLPTYHRLTTLDLAANALGPAGARLVAAALAGNRSVAVLDVSDNGLGLAGLGHLATLLASGNKTLRTLFAQRNDMGPHKPTRRALKAAVDGCQGFADAMARGGCLTALNLSGNRFGPDAAEALTSRLQDTPLLELGLESAALCGTGGDDAPDLRALRNIVRATHRSLAAPIPAATESDTAAAAPPLRALLLGNNELGEAGGALIAAEAAAEVETLSLGRNAMGDAAVGALLASLARGSSSIRVLDLSHNNLYDAAPFAEALPRLCGLVALNVAHNRLGDGPQAFTSMLAAVGCGNLLASLNLAGNLLGTRSAHINAIVDLCGRATAPFAALDVMHNPNLSLRDVEAALLALKANPAIAYFAASSAGEDRDQLGATAREVLAAGTSGLTELNLCFPPDTDDEALDAVRASLLRTALGRARGPDFPAGL